MDRMMKSKFVALALSLSLSQSVLAGGVGLSATRVIYDGSKKEASLTVQNKSKTEEFLIQSWVDDAAGSKKTPFIITPPLFRQYIAYCKYYPWPAAGSRIGLLG